MILRSSAFQDGDEIPLVHSCEGDDRSPPLEWDDLPPGTETLAIIMEDPDAPRGTWVHWVLFNLPASEPRIPEGASSSPRLPEGTREGTNSWGRSGYAGPCPPSGTHRYVFRSYALDRALDLAPAASAADVIDAIAGRALAEAVLVGLYGRP